MANKMQMYSEVAEATAASITGSFQKWTSFLDTAARLYKYPFHEQLMIYAQRPEAIACASFETWNETMRRYIKRGSKGIALIDPETQKLRYVFDVADTGARENSRRLYLWEYNDSEHFEAVSKALEKKYGISGENSVAGLLEAAAAKLTDDFINANRRDILSSVEGSFLEDYDEFNIEESFRNAATVSATYMLARRCGLEPMDFFTPEDYLSVFDFNTQDAVYSLGTAISKTSEDILRTIETTVKNYERDKRIERNDEKDFHQTVTFIPPQTPTITERNNEYDNNIYTKWGLHDSKPHDRSADANRQVRENENELSQDIPFDSSKQDDTSRETQRTFIGDRSNSERTAGASDDRNVSEGGSNREDEGREPDEVGGTDEQLESTSGRNNSKRTDLRINEQSWEQLSLFPSEEEQIAIIDSIEPEKNYPLSFSENEINDVLIHGSNARTPRLAVIAEFEKQKPISEIADFLKEEYRGAAGFKSEKGDFSVRYDADGIRLSRGREVKKSAQVISWEDAAERIEKLLNDGRFASNVELLEARHKELSSTAESLWYMVRDLSEDYKDSYFSFLQEGKTASFPDSVAQIVSGFENPEYVQRVLSEMQAFRRDYSKNREILRFHFYRPDRIEKSLSDLLLQRTQFQTNMTEVPLYRGFITDDEIADAIRRRHVEDGDFRIYDFFSAEHTAKEKADFLKNEYGMGGSAPGWNADHSSIDYSSKGISLKKDGCTEIQMPWINVARFVDKLISKDQYLSPDRKEEYERRKLITERDVETKEPTAVESIEFKQTDNKPTVADLEVGDIIMYDGSRREVESISDHSISLKDLDAPDFGGILLGTSDVLAYDGWQQDMESKGFEILTKSEKLNEIDAKERIDESISEDTPTNPTLADAIVLINEYTQREFGQDADYSDLEHVDIAFSTMENDDIPIQVTADLIHQRMRYEVGGKEVATIDFDDTEELHDFLGGLDFSEQIAYAEEHWEEQQALTDFMDRDPIRTYDDIEVSDEQLAPFHGKSTDKNNFDLDELLSRDKFEMENIVFGLSLDNHRLYATVPIARYDSMVDRFSENLDLRYAKDDYNIALYTDGTVNGTSLRLYSHNNAYYTVDKSVLSVEERENIDIITEKAALKIAEYAEEHWEEHWEEQQKTNAQTVQESPLSSNTANVYSEQSLIDKALIAWNGNPDSKRAVCEYMQSHARDRDTANWLANEFGGDIAKPFEVQDGITIPWPKVQRRIAQLINSGEFVTETELSEAVHDVEKTEIPTKQDEMASPHYFVGDVGDTVYIDNTAFEITEIGLFDVQLRDPSLLYPIFRAESKEHFEDLLRLDERNANLFVTEENPPMDYTYETVADFSAEKVGLPFDVTVERMRIDEPVCDLTSNAEKNIDEILDENPITVEINGEWHTYPNADAANNALHEAEREATRAQARNFRILDDDLGKGGAKEKFWRNVKAIAVLKEIEGENRNATPEEQHILSQYVGWGGLSDAFDDSKPNWEAEYSELKNILTSEEYTAARASTLNAHYTSPTVIKAIYEALGNMGFETGNILEPSMGVGNFFGLLPESMQSSKLYGVELDNLTGRIAKQLYPMADITVAGFETTDRRDFYDLAVGNVPFGNYKVNDRAYNKLGFSIHDYFFAKTLDQVRSGGVIAFVTSRYTMDKQSPEVRKYIAERAELLGAIRLPNNAFKANAGTEVVSDIIFLQKRDRPIVIDEDWIHLGKTEDGFTLNSYFVDHPEMVLGTLSSESTQYGKEDLTVEPIAGADLSKQLNEAIQHISGKYQEAELSDLGGEENNKVTKTIPADPSVKNYSYAVIDGEVYFRENSVMVMHDLSATSKERIKGMVELRDCVQKLIREQADGYSDSEIAFSQTDLNRVYDRFTAKFGLINSKANQAAFSQDSSYYLLCSLEELDENKNLSKKADIFTKRTIRPHEVVTSVDTASEALALSVSEKAAVDMGYMSALTGKDEETIASDLRGVIFKDYERDGSDRYTYRTSDDFLSGNVREKLKYYESIADSTEGDKHQAVLDNIEALKAAQPKDLDASQIEVRLGATWIDKDYIRQFMLETFDPPYYLRHNVQVNFSDVTAEWSISNKSLVADRNFNTSMNYGTGRMNPYKILEDTLNLRDVRVYDTVTDIDGKERRVLNEKETTLAQQKQQAIKDAFKDWIWKDPKRRDALVTRYNEIFNSTRPREYDGSHINFAGMNSEITLRDHQKNAIAHILYGGNTLLAHEVGAGKTFEMAAAAMESKRLGLCQKSLFVVPNHLTEQWASEFLRLYPAANILAATKKDFEPSNRKKFCARIATGDYDAVIIGHSQFEKIPMSYERQEKLLWEQIEEITDGIAELKGATSERFTVKQLEKTKKSLEAKLEKLQAQDRKDDVVTFEQLGIDRLFVDEAHSYKNLFLYTKMRNVAGLSTSDAQKSSDMFMKCRYLDEKTGNKGVIFATGTPVSNSMTELYTMQRYLQYDLLKRLNMSHFDCWASTFGETTTALELDPAGSGYRARTRFAKFFNLPELMNIFKETADIKTADQLNLPTPKAVFHNVVAQPTEIQKEMVHELSERAAKVHSGSVDSSVDNMLKITSDGRKLGLDQRIINPNLPDEPTSKVNMCVNNIYKIWDEGKENKLTQLVFCDLSTPKGVTGSKETKMAKSLDNPELNAILRLNEDDGDKAFSVYEDIRKKLTEKGIPKEEIAFIHEANTEAKKKDLFSKVRSGQVRVLMGSTFKMGAGTNVQDRLVALHDLDAPWRPGDLEQRLGRIVRQGNKNPTVQIFRYMTEATFDAYLWQTLENKQKFISQIMTSKSPVRSADDLDETALSYAEIKALCAGDPRIKEKMDLDVDVARLKLLKANHQSQQYKLEDNLLKHFPEKAEHLRNCIKGFEKDIETLASHAQPKDGFVGMTVRGDVLTDKENAGAALLDSYKEAQGVEPVNIGSYRGFEMFITLENFGQDYFLTLKGKMSHKVELGSDARGNLTRIDNALNNIQNRLNSATNELENVLKQIDIAKQELGKPFPQEEELKTKSERLNELNAELNIDELKPLDQGVAAKEKPSILERLKQPAVSKKTVGKPKNIEMEER